MVLSGDVENLVFFLQYSSSRIVQRTSNLQSGYELRGCP